jgi:hypothetical protein
MQILEHPNKRLLSGVLRILPLAEHPVTEAKNLPLIPLDERKHGRLIARQAPPNERPEVTGAGSAHRHCRRMLYRFPPPLVSTNRRNLKNGGVRMVF